MFKTTVSFVMLAASLLSGSPASAETSPPDLDSILRSDVRTTDTGSIPNLRLMALKETALMYGSQAGLARRSFEIRQRLEKQSKSLDVVFTFQHLMLEGNVIPPVLTETSDYYEQTSDDMLRIVGKVFRIEQQARFAYVTPNWRAYMQNQFTFDPDLVTAVKPKTSEENSVWKTEVEVGFKIGVNQAEEILKQNFANLRRDYLGMVLYHRMLDNNLVTKPYVASNRQNVSKATDGSLHVGEVFMRISANPEFVGEPAKWESGNKTIAADRLNRLMAPEPASRTRQ